MRESANSTHEFAGCNARQSALSQRVHSVLAFSRGPRTRSGERFARHRSV